MVFSKCLAQNKVHNFEELLTVLQGYKVNFLNYIGSFAVGVSNQHELVKWLSR